MNEAIALSWNLLPPKPILVTEVPRSSASSCSRVSFICVKFGSKYSAAYVNALATAIVTHTHDATLVNDRIICLTNDAGDINTDIVDCRPLPPHPWSGWWHKANIFSAPTGNDSVFIYLDLDTIIINSLRKLIEYALQFVSSCTAPLVTLR